MKMKIFTWRDALFTALLALAITPFGCYFVGGVVCLPKLLANPDSQVVLSRLARRVAQATGWSIEDAVHFILLGPAAFWCIVYSALGGKKWMRKRNLEMHRKNRHIRRSFQNWIRGRKSQQPFA